MISLRGTTPFQHIILHYKLRLLRRYKNICVSLLDMMRVCLKTLKFRHRLQNAVS